VETPDPPSSETATTEQKKLTYNNLSLSVMDKQNEQYQQEEQSQCDGVDGKRRLGSIKPDCQTIGVLPNSVFNSDRHRGHQNREKSNSSRRGKIAGGMLSQLIEDTNDQLAYHEMQLYYYENQINKLKRRLKHFSLLKQQVDLLSED
jgi:hypothetical protein